MKREDVTDEWLYENMPIVDDAMMREEEKGVDEGYVFSDEFERKMEDLIRKERRISFWGRASAVGRRVAVLVLVALCSLLTAFAVAFASSETFRTMVVSALYPI